jgi:hypothetical protein
MEAKTNVEVIGVALDSPVLIKSEQCVDIMVLDDSPAPKNCSTSNLVCSSSARVRPADLCHVPSGSATINEKSLYRGHTL